MLPLDRAAPVGLWSGARVRESARVLGALARDRVRPGVWAALLIGLAVCFYLWPVLIGGRVLSPGVSLYHYVPWQSAAPHGWQLYDNLSLNDATTDYYPWWVFARQLLVSGHFPTWNPYELAGSPAFSNVNTLVLSPFGLPSLLLPLKYSFGVAAAIKLWVAGFGMYLLVRQLSLAFWPGILGGLAYAFASHPMIFLVDPILNVIVLLPLCVWLTERLVQHARLSDGCWLAVAVGSALLGGHPASEVYVVGAVVLYAGGRLLLSPTTSTSIRARRGLLVAGGIGLGVGIAAVALLPLGLLVPGSTGLGSRIGGGVVLPPSTLRTLLLPDWWGRPGGGVLSAAGPLSYSARTIFAGATVFGLGVVGALASRDWRRRVPVALVGLIAVAHTFGVAPVHQLLVLVFPVKDVSTIEAAFVIEFAVALLASYGLHDLMAGGRAVRIKLRAVIGVLAAVGVIGVIAKHPSGTALYMAATDFIDGKKVTSPESLALRSVMWLLLFTSLLAIAVWLGRRVRSAAVLAIAVVAVTGIELEHFVHGFQPMAPASRIFAGTPAAVRFLQLHAGTDRVAGIGTALPPDTAGAYGLRDVRGYDPPEPDPRFIRLFGLANPKQATAGYFGIREQLGIPVMTLAARRVLQILGARYIIQGPTDKPLAEPGLTLVYRGADATIYRDGRAARRAYVPHAVTVRNNDGGAFAAVARPGRSPASNPVVTAPRGTTAAAASGSVRVVNDQPGAVTLQADLTSAGVVVLNEHSLPGWQVQVDHHTRQVLRVNYVLQGVEAPSGHHIVTWHYHAPGLRTGLIVTTLALSTALVGLLYSVRRQRDGRST